MNKITALFFLLFALAFIACENPPTPESSTKVVGIYLTDCPFEADEVNVEILGVTVEDTDGFEIELNTATGIYNLLEFANGVDTLLASGNVEFENIEALYLELGENNTIVVEGETFPLDLQADSRVKVNINWDQLAQNTDLVIDFYACTSIIRKNGEYILKPVVKFKGEKPGNSGGGGQGNADRVEDWLEDLGECYTINYPLTLETLDGIDVTANTDEELVDALINNDIKKIVFPFSVTSADGDVVDVNNNGTLNQLINDCGEGNGNQGGGNGGELKDLRSLLECYTLSYPIQLHDESDTLSVANDEELFSALEDQLVVGIVFPFEITDADGMVISVTDKDMLEDLADACDDDEEDDEEEEEEDDENEDDFASLVEDLEECYTLVFPLEVRGQGNTIYEVQSREDLGDLMDNTELVKFEYPLQVLDEDGNAIDVENNGQLNQLIEDCE